MSYSERCEDALGKIEAYALGRINDEIVIEFPEGDSYCCQFDTNDWECDDEKAEDGSCEEWFALIFRVKAPIVPGPNKDPRFEYITISEKHMPLKVTSGETVLYEQASS